MMLEKESTDNFAQKGKDINHMDVITFVDGGKVEEGQFGLQHNFLVTLTNGENKAISVNKTSRNTLIDAYGNNSDLWVGKQALVWLFDDVISGKPVKKLFLSAPGLDLNGVAIPAGQPGAITVNAPVPNTVPDPRGPVQIPVENIPF